MHARWQSRSGPAWGCWHRERLPRLSMPREPNWPAIRQGPEQAWSGSALKPLPTNNAPNAGEHGVPTTVIPALRMPSSYRERRPHAADIQWSRPNSRPCGGIPPDPRRCTGGKTALRPLTHAVRARASVASTGAVHMPDRRRGDGRGGTVGAEPTSLEAPRAHASQTRGPPSDAGSWLPHVRSTIRGDPPAS
jgi:hypothetical protein